MGDAMAEIERLREQFIAAFEAGESPDPREYLTQLEGADQRELEALLDAYLAQAPRRRFDAQAFAASPARALVDDLDQSLSGVAGAWPVVLPRLRNAARLRRGDLVRAARREPRRHEPRGQGGALLPRDGAGAAASGRRLRPRARRAREPAPHHPRATPRGGCVRRPRAEASHPPRCSHGPRHRPTTSSPRWRPRPPRRPSPRPATRWTSCSSADERCQARAVAPDLTGMVNPYRVLAFAVESGDRQLTTLLTARLFRPAPASNAAWRTLSRLVAALDLR